MEQSVEERLLQPAGFLATFEQLASLVPAAIAIATAPSYIYQAFCRKRCAQINSLLCLKLAVISVLSAVQINDVFRWWETLPQERTLVHWAAVASYISMPSLALIVLFDHLLSQPFLIRDVLIALSCENPPAHVTKTLVSTTIMVYFGLTASSVWAASSRATFTAAIRGITETAMYNKCLVLNASKLEMSLISSIMYNDVNNLGPFINAVWDNWNIALETIFNVTVLACWYGPSAILLVLPALLAGANAIRVSRHELRSRQEWRSRTADHVAFTSNILAQMKDVKMLGLGSFFGKLMQHHQKAEISASLPVRDAESIGFIQGAFTESVTPMMAVAIAVFPLISSEALSMPELCAAAGIGLVSMQPLAYAVRSMSDRVRGFDCMDRIQKFLLQRENQDSRVCAPERLRIVERDPCQQQDVVTAFAVQFIDDVDLARLAYGALTLAGSRGSNLSAGQRQRISLARSLYAREEIIVVDDIFTSLDKRTASDIRVRLFGETEALQAHNITLIMTTTMREHLVDADVALEITNEGLIIESSAEDSETNSEPLPNPLREGTANGVTAPYAPPLVGSRVNDLPSRAYADFGLYNFYLKPAGISLFLLWVYSLCAAATVENLPVIFICFWMETYFYFIYTRTAKALYAKVANTACRATLDYLTSTDTDFLLNKFCQEVSLATERLPLLLLPAAWNFVLLIINMTAFGLATSGIVLPSVLLLYLFLVQYFLGRSTRNARTLREDASTDVSRHLSDTVSGADHIHAFGWQSAFLRQFYVFIKDQHRTKFSELCLGLWALIMISISSAIAAIAIVAHVLNSQKETSAGIFAFAMFSVIVFTNNMNMLIHPWVSSDVVLGGLHGIRNFVNSTPVEQAPTNAASVPTEWARRGKIELSCVTAQYRPIGGARHIALDHVTFTIQPGQVVGIAGRTGSGKTSLFLAMLNLLHFEGGILIDDREIRSLPHELLRSRITIMTQSVLELLGTVRFNVNPFDPELRPAPFLLQDDMLIGIFRRVGLWDHIEEHGGLDVQIRLMQFSHGQKQLFQLARAMLHKQMMRTRIIFIDEGAPNAEIEDHMRQVMREVFANCTILMVSHRPSLFREADRILTIDAGKTCLYEHDRERGTWSANRWNGTN
ncbi:hypothetical protein PWT90_03899 [Aphanocladium album]|nr:hypothetical protein PWT90_03899 [Aphanocladium album]